MSYNHFNAIRIHYHGNKEKKDSCFHYGYISFPKARDLSVEALCFDGKRSDPLLFTLAESVHHEKLQNHCD